MDTNNQSLQPNARYYGMQLIKHWIRFHWLEAQNEEHSFIKSQVLNLIASTALTEPPYIKGLLASVLTEIIKQVWPQNWANMHTELISSCTSKENAADIEIVITVFLALAEDIALYQNIPVKSRARDLRQALSLASKDIVKFLVNILKQQVMLVSTAINDAYVHLAKIALQAMTAYVEWINIDLFFIDEEGLLQTLLYLLEQESLQVQACQCLHAIVCRKGHISERRLLLRLMDDKYVERYVLSVKNASLAAGFNQSRFQFLCCIGKVVAALVHHLITVWNSQDESNQDFPKDILQYKNFLELLYFIASHHSRYISATVLTALCNLLRHQQIRKDKTIQLLVPVLLDVITRNLCKDFTSQNDFSQFEDLEFNGKEEKNNFIKSFRFTVIELLRFCTCVSPLVAIKACFQYTQAELKKRYESMALCYIGWEGTLTFMETVSGSVLKAADDCNEKDMLPIAEAESLMYTLLTNQTKDEIMLKIFLNCGYSLCKIVALSTEPKTHFKVLLDKIFEILDATYSEASLPRTSLLRRAACAIIVRVSKNHPDIMLSLMDHFKSVVLERLSKTPCVLSPFERVSMFESLVLLSMEWKSLSAQSELIGNIMSTADYISKSDILLSALQSSRDFANAIGLYSVPSNMSQVNEGDSCSDFRSGIYYYLAVTLAVMNRTKSIENNDNPCCLHVGIAIEHTLMMTQMLSAMWSSDVQPFIHPQNLKALQLKESEKLTLMYHNLDHITEEKSKSEGNPKEHWERLQNFLILCLDNCYQILGLAGKILGPRFYVLLNLEQVIVRKALANMELLPVMRLKSLLRHFLGNFLKHCPLEYLDSIIGPLLTSYCQIIMERLRKAWEAFGAKAAERLQGLDSNQDDADNMEEGEMIDEQLLRLLTREHLDILINLFVNKQPSPNMQGNQETTNEDDVEMTSQNHSVENLNVVLLTSLGAAIINHTVCESVLCSALEAMSWHDTTSCFKSTQLLSPLLKMLLQKKENLFNKEVTRIVLQSILHGLHRHGQHDGCEATLASLALSVIGPLHHKHMDVISSLLHSVVPDVDIRQINTFLENYDKTSEKKRKTNFKRLMSGMILHHVGQQFKEVPKMNEFSPFSRIQNKPVKVEHDQEYLGLADLFQPNNNSK
ncbi:unnamed protein product [Clavelina lepadiformis]|uniref:Exportin-5 n=1 Tax=Clavelina lepadiformis TaxID=159417 RepID=A0ABP0F2K0_CLALP